MTWERTMAENLDNEHRKINIKIRGLKEGIEGEDLVGYLTEYSQLGWGQIAKY